MGVFNILLQGIDHFHNGTIDARLLAAVVHVVVSIHHAVGDGVQLAGVLAELAHGVAHDQPGQRKGDKYGGQGQDDADGPGSLVLLVAVLAGLPCIGQGDVRQFLENCAEGIKFLA